MALPKLTVVPVRHGSPSTAEVSVVTRTAAIVFAAIVGAVVSLFVALRLLRDDDPGFDRDYREAVNALRERVRRSRKLPKDHSA